MNRRTSLCLASLILSTSAVGGGVASKGQETLAAKSRATNSHHTKWAGKSLQEIQKIKVGMTRAQLTKVFTTEGGLSSRKWRRYVYRECPYIKVDVEFKPVGTSKKYPHAESRNDVITKISKPFLEQSIMD